MNKRIVFDDTDALFLSLKDEEKEMYPVQLTTHLKELQAIEEIIRNEK